MKNKYLPLLPALLWAFSILWMPGCFNRYETEEREENEAYDGPDKAAEWRNNLRKDPATGVVPSDKMWQAVMETEVLKNLQRNSPNTVSALSWTERGSESDAPGPSGNSRPPGAVTSGRIDAILVDKADPTGKTVWIGGDMGGLWKTTDITASPANWSLINDFMGNLVISAITQDPVNTNIMYFATGEGYYGGELGVGVFKSTDHGINWTLLPSTTAYTKNTKMLCDNAGNVYLATTLNGLRRSSDGGTTWTDITPAGVSNRIADLELSSTGRMHVCVGILGSTQDYRYTDIPATVTSAAGWTAPVTSFTSGNQRAEIGVVANTLYALPCVSNQVPAIYKSIDGGANWTSLGAPPASYSVSTFANGQAWYDLAVAINPGNPEECIIGGLDNMKTTNGGSTWTRITQWVGSSINYVHADQHTSIWYDNGNKLLLGCDGGIFYSANGGTNFNDKNTGLRLKEFYSCAMHPSSTNYFLAGAQDNGTHQFNGPGLTSSIEVTGGDGAYVDIDQDQPQYQFAAYVHNQYRRSSDGGTSWQSFNFSDVTGQFINPFDYDDAGNKMYCSNTAGQYLRWDNPQTATSLATSTTASIPVTSFLGGSVISVAVSPFTANRVYFGTDNGRVVKVDNANTATPADVSITGTGMSSGGSVNCINTGSSDQYLVACFSNYNITNIWVSADGGSNWVAHDGNLPNMPVYWAIFHPDNNNKMIIATETGVWETDQLNGGATVWTPCPNFPTVSTSMLKYRSSDRTLLASTYGRGLWSTTVPSGCTAAGITAQPANSRVCAPANASFSITATGTGFQWQESTTGGSSWTNISNGGVYAGAATTTLTLTGVTAVMNNNLYRCIVSGDCAPLTATSNNALLNVDAAAVITSQPAASSICANSTTFFSVTATGSSVTYQWQVSTNGGASFTNLSNIAPYAAVTTSTLTISAAPATLNAYQYRCVIGSGVCASVTSAAAVLTVNAPPAVVTPPANTAICAGNAVSFSVGASGAVSYQWQLSTDGGLSFNNISGAVAATYGFTATLAQHNYQYRCIVSGTCTPSATSAAATLSVGSSLFINTQPSASVTCAGGNASYTISVSGSVTYQWQESTDGGTTYSNISNGGIYSNANTASLILTGVPASANNNLYRCTVSGSCPTINSNSALLTVNTLPSITTQPAVNSIICAGQNTSFTVAASGTGIGYQWQLSTDGGLTFNNISNGGVYSNADTATLNITGAPAAMNNYKYRCVATGTCAPSVNSNTATLAVNTPVTVNSNPAGTTVCENSNASFSVTAAGSSPSYQWQVSTNGGSSFTNVTNGGVYTGATTATLNAAGVSFALNNNLYRCIISGTAPCGAVNSASAALIVNAAPALFTVTGGGAYCAGGAGVPVGLSNSTTGFNYQLLLNGINSGAPAAGTGSALSFGNKTAAGTYTVIASNNITGCTQTMTGSAAVVVNPLPGLTFTAAPYTRLYPGLVTTLTATATSTANPINYLWFKNNNQVNNAASSLQVTIAGFGDYRVAVTDANGCSSQSQVITIADSANSKLFIYPTPNNGQFAVVYYNQGGANVKRVVTIYSNKGEKVYSNEFLVTAAYQLLNIDMRRNGAGVYYVIVSDVNGHKLKSGEVLVR